MNNTTKYLGGIATALVLVAGLAGCGSRTETSTSSTSSTQAPTTTTTKAPATTTTTQDALKTAPQSLKIEAYVEVYQEEFPGTSRSTAISTGESACELIEAEGSIADAMIAIALNPDIGTTMAGDMAFVMGISVPVFCPRFMPELNAITRN